MEGWILPAGLVFVTCVLYRHALLSSLAKHTFVPLWEARLEIGIPRLSGALAGRRSAEKGWAQVWLPYFLATSRSAPSCSAGGLTHTHVAPDMVSQTLSTSPNSLLVPGAEGSDIGGEEA